MDHGKVTTYQRDKCRCEECRRAIREYTAARRKKGLPADDPRHGTPNGYTNYGCRCGPCREAHAHKNGTRLALDDPRHGTTMGYYTLGCRCAVCRDATTGMGRRNNNLKTRYGLAVPEWEELLADQGGCCAGCGRACEGVLDSTFATDHDHTTGEIRGILCRSCNQALGMVYDSPQTLRNLANYLEVPPFFRF